jgi:hypothetical protein
MTSKNQKAGNLPTPTDDPDRQLLADLNDPGWHVIAVPEDEEGPAFAYSIGLHHSFGHPEVILFGLKIEVMFPVINGIGEQVKAGKHFDHLNEEGDILDGYNVIFRTVERKHYSEYFGYARWLYRGDDFPALQCVWPDAQSRYPWHPQFSPQLAQRQPVLSEEKVWPFHEGKNRAVFTTKPVTQGGHPVLLVSHDRDGNWQLLCGTTNRAEDAQLVALGQMLKRHPEIGSLADLPEGWRAHRTDTDSPWCREEMESDHV